MPQTPLTASFPLKNAPYSSRVSSNLNGTKNYYLLAFNPGYALQAAELNEIQELFFLNQSLSLRYSNVWFSQGFAKPGFWEGLVPYDPSKITVILQSTTSTSISVQITIQPTWYLWTDKTSKLTFWVYNPKTITQQSFNNTSGGPEYIGFILNNTQIKCCQSNPCDSEQDETLRDNFMEFTCGASRFNLGFGECVIQNAITDDFYPIIKLDPTQISENRITFYDGQPVAFTN